MSFKKIITKDKKRLLELECDQCGKIYIKRYCKRFLDPNKLVFCSKDCSNKSLVKGGKTEKKRRQTSLKKYGVECPIQSEEIKKKYKRTCFDRYGVDHPSQSKEIQRKYQQTCLKRFGVKNPFRSEQVRSKINWTKIRDQIKKTCLDRYGVDHPWKLKEIQKKRKKSFQEKYGVENPFQSEKIKERSKQTCLEKYGVEYAIQANKIKEKFRQTCLKKYGVDHPWKSKKIRASYDQHAISQKRHKTMKFNETYGKSKAEDKFYDLLCNEYGSKNVERQAKVHMWNIDFYIRTVNAYIQFDGIYWHGLDRPIETIKEFKNSRDKIIYETYLRDQTQNEWFEKNCLLLVRVTDEKFMNT